MQTAQYEAVLQLIRRNEANAQLAGTRKCFQDLIGILTDPMPESNEDRSARMHAANEAVISSAQIYAMMSAANPALKVIANVLGATSFGLNLAIAVAEATVTLEEVTPPVEPTIQGSGIHLASGTTLSFLDKETTTGAWNPVYPDESEEYPADAFDDWFKRWSDQLGNGQGDPWP